MPDWAQVHPAGLASLADLAELESERQGRTITPQKLWKRIVGSKSGARRYAPAVVGHTAAGTIYDKAVYLEIAQGADR